MGMSDVQVKLLFTTWEEYCTVPQMIPNRKWSRDRKWSLKSTANDPVKSWGMEWILWDWLQKRTDYKKESSFSSLKRLLCRLKRKGRRTLHIRSIYTRWKKNWINLKRYGINRILLPLSIASIFFWRSKNLQQVAGRTSSPAWNLWNLLYIVPLRRPLSGISKYDIASL